MPIKHLLLDDNDFSYKESGIYGIFIGGKYLYVGQVYSLRQRAIKHASEVRRGVHKNRHLMSVWKTYSNSVLFFLVEKCPVSELNKREDYWMSQLLPNLNKATAPEGITSYGGNPVKLYNSQTKSWQSFVSQSDAARVIGCPVSTINHLLAGRVKVISLIWKSAPDINSMERRHKSITLRNIKTGKIMTFKSRQELRQTLGRTIEDQVYDRKCYKNFEIISREYRLNKVVKVD